MNCNLGPIERWVRLFIGLILLSVGKFLMDSFEGWSGVVVLWVSLLALLTGALRWCPLTWLRHRVLHR